MAANESAPQDGRVPGVGASVDRLTEAHVREVKAAAERIFTAVPKSKRMEYLGDLNDVFLFIEDTVRLLRQIKEMTARVLSEQGASKEGG